MVARGPAPPVDEWPGAYSQLVRFRTVFNGTGVVAHSASCLRMTLLLLIMEAVLEKAKTEDNTRKSLIMIMLVWFGLLVMLVWFAEC
jgi:hypothetical protein